MKVSITGATGFLGQRLAVRLKTLGYDVMAIGRDGAKGAMLTRIGIPFISVELANQHRVLEVIAGSDIVYHCAALSSPWGKFEDFYQCNVTATENVISACQKHNVKRLIHVSTPSVYFNFTDRYNIRETDPLPEKAVNHYAYTKRVAEERIQTAVKEGLGCITIRPRGIFGPGDSSVFPRMIRANEKGFLPLIDNGKAYVDITYVDNVVDALILCLNADKKCLGKFYNITNEDPWEIREILDLLFKELGLQKQTRSLPYWVGISAAWVLEMLAKIMTKKEPLLTRYSVGVLAKSQTLDTTAAREELGYRPQISIEEGINLFARWWRDKNHVS